MWIELEADVMVAGFPRKTGEILQISEGDGNLLIGLRRAKISQEPVAACEVAAPSKRRPVPPQEA